MPDNIWDDPRLARGEYVKFVNIGDGITGTILAQVVQVWEDVASVKYTILEDGETEPRMLTASQYQLQTKLRELNPVNGDRVEVKFTSIKPLAGGKTMKEFDVKVTKAAPVAAPAGVPATSLLG